MVEAAFINSALRLGAVCDCGKYTAFSGYVYAHWNDPLVFLCESCGANYDLLAGRTRRRKDAEPVDSA
jgi:hypothetical protein